MSSTFRQLRITWRHRAEKSLYVAGLRRAPSQRFPAFLGIGAQKAGTSWLHKNMAQHPELFLPRRKELHYFCCRFETPLSGYLHHFNDAGDRMIGEITPEYSIISDRRVRFIARMQPELKTILMIRHPVERAWSHAYMNLVSEANRPFEDVPLDAFIEHFNSAGSRERSDYLRVIDRWAAVFSRERMFVGVFDDIAERPRELLESVFRFLGVSTEIDWSSLPYAERVYPQLGRGQRDERVSTRETMPDACREALEAIYREPIERMIERIGPRISHWSISGSTGAS